MKILKAFGIVVGIHVFFFIAIFANPGCSSSSKPPATAETAAKADTPSTPITVPTVAAAEAVPAGFNPDAPATAAPAGSGIRFTPTRPTSPAATALTAEPVKDVTPMTTYTVKSGDSLWTIASKNKISYQELAAANNMKSNVKLQPGQKLIIPGKNPAPAAMAASVGTPSATGAAPASAPADTSGKPAPLRHTVITGDTVGSIALKYHVREKDLLLANNISDPRKLPLGKELVIPGWDTPAGKAATTTGKSTGKASTGSRTSAERPAPAAAEPAVPVISFGTQPSPAPASSDVPVIPVTETPKKP